MQNSHVVKLSGCDEILQSDWSWRFIAFVLLAFIPLTSKSKTTTLFVLRLSVVQTQRYCIQVSRLRIHTHTHSDTQTNLCYNLWRRGARLMIPNLRLCKFVIGSLFPMVPHHNISWRNLTLTNYTSEKRTIFNICIIPLS